MQFLDFDSIVFSKLNIELFSEASNSKAFWKILASQFTKAYGFYREVARELWVDDGVNSVFLWSDG